MKINVTQYRHAHSAAREPLIGLASLMSMAFSGADLAPLGARLIERAGADPADANALMDLSTLLQLRQSKDLGLAAQQQALQVQQLYRHPAARGAPALRLLAFMAPGDLMANTPLEFLLQDSDVALEMLYIMPGLPFPPPVPEHDLAFVAVCESERNRALLRQLDALLQSWPRPVCNRPGRIGLTARETAGTLLAAVPQLLMPISARVDRQILEQIGSGERALAGVVEDGRFPVIVRPLDSHAGHGLAKIDAPVAVAAYLHGMPEREFCISPFVDYRGADGLYRKYRVILIDGRPYAGHMGISGHWMIHYLNAGMSESAAKRAEEQSFMENFDEDFALRHADALGAIAARIGLDYLVIDCGETRDGRLLVFELDPGAVVHCMDPADVFPYKQAQMRKVFGAFRGMLLNSAAASAGRRRPA